ncbi:hypothetical protein JDV02_008776 [Purpureocillium takamizusanense]|uniref:NAD(P)-binding domain-containing protein n=1 Tax=Purpureocillium takamizusanense TaxID=2060973 RepID=A0A9Q8QPE2_9HYPO|nr:uncharacterized protein JDV02_008776 [Purpureocillium takamizusanense]UNI22932.1 hypothetical protein JDV02_008776 [Purpureocillium takamizusanense]
MTGWGYKELDGFLFNITNITNIDTIVNSIKSHHHHHQQQLKSINAITKQHWQSLPSHFYTTNHSTYHQPNQLKKTKMAKTIAFLGATGGCGLSALRRAVAAGHTCIALCRTPSKLAAQFPDRPANLHLREGNAHDVASVAACLSHPSDPARLVDAVNFSLGGVMNMAKLTLDDPDVCKKGIAALLDAIAAVRAERANDDNGSSINSSSWRPLLAVVSTTGISQHGRDVPLLFVPFYYYALHVPHEDKRVAEKSLFESGERVVAVRPSLLVDGEKPDKPIRVHVEGPGGIERKEVGYFISRDDVGRWMFDNLLQKADDGGAAQYEGKAVGLTW